MEPIGIIVIAVFVIAGVFVLKWWVKNGMRTIENVCMTRRNPVPPAM
jgi:hypothetical protein